MSTATGNTGNKTPNKPAAPMTGSQAKPSTPSGTSTSGQQTKKPAGSCGC